MKPILAVFVFVAACAAQPSMDTVTLRDPARGMEVTIWPSLGNIAGVFSVHGQNVFWIPAGWPRPALAGNPFLAPWANRFDQDAFYANGKKYLLNPALKNFVRDPNGHPIHGLLAFSPLWKVVSHTPEEAVSRLEFWKYPDLMAQFPFAHAIQMTYRLRDGALEVRTRIENLSTEPMPLAIGYHPYFRLHDSPRESWKVHIAARSHVEISKDAIPTGKLEPVALQDPQPLAGMTLDDVFTDLVRDAGGRAEFWVEGKTQKISVLYGPKYTVAIAYSPRGSAFICFEPMTALTNGFNLAQAGLYKDLQSIAPGAVWEESYWIRPAGF
jgi:aldose 1-epimerase